MPTYQYRCTECGEDLEAFQKFSDAALTTCPTCGGQLRKVFNPVGVVFKGSGFYRTDSRNGSKSRPDGDSGPSEKKVETKSADTKSADKESAGAASNASGASGNGKQPASSGTSSTAQKPSAS
jgi:putative FmdB family regulatory protein